MFFGCVVISDLYLFQELVLLNPCYIFYKNLILSFIDKVTTGKQSFVLVITKFTPAMLLFCSVNAQSFVHDKSSSISQFVNGKSKDLQKELRYMIEIVTSTCKIGTGGRFASPSFPSLSGLVFTQLFLFYIQIYYHLKHYHQHHQFCLYNNSIKFLMS